MKAVGAVLGAVAGVVGAMAGSLPPEFSSGPRYTMNRTDDAQFRMLIGANERDVRLAHDKQKRKAEKRRRDRDRMLLGKLTKRGA